MITYNRADEYTVKQLSDVRTEYHSDLCEPEVTVDILFTEDVDADGESVSSLKHHGYPAIAVIKQTSLKERALGLADALLIIDAVSWDGMLEKERVAVLDHELTHLEVKRDGEGVAILDDLGRPKLKMRMHDWEVGGFKSVVERHRSNAAEVKAIRACVDMDGQYFWDWGRPRAVA